ncbi:MAG: UDP-N-acetylmuramoyl-L-alanine--D-glutamate ligase [Parachlamydiaceae bacterium]|nr:UDP-N-acetylmuramoyl-L-alanine--D-glutamate ligase [Parachlamydiaceae bacterium]
MMKRNRVLVVGLGVSGRAAVQLLLSQGIKVHAVDSNRELLKTHPDIQAYIASGVSVGHDSEQLDLSQFDSVVVSPGVPQTHPLYRQAQARNMPLLGEIELACRSLKGTFLGVTGTNGKTTVTLLVTHVLNESGKAARALGNVGTPLAAQCCDVATQDIIFVVELSSFQLETLHSHIIDAAVLLNVTPDHLDRYKGMNEYARAKLHIADCLKPNGSCYIEEKCWNEFGHLTPQLHPKLYGYSHNCEISTDLQSLVVDSTPQGRLPDYLQGKSSHDLENLMAAYALCRHVGVTAEQFLSALATFKKPSHRIEFVCAKNGITYYDDSKGTNIDAVLRAVEALPGKIVLIAGGVDKGAPYTPWEAPFSDKVKAIYAIGQAASKIQKDLAHAIPVTLCATLEEAIKGATSVAASGDNVLLSPGCSSFDMFRDYAHRGEEFQRMVRSL